MFIGYWGYLGSVGKVRDTTFGRQNAYFCKFLYINHHYCNDSTNYSRPTVLNSIFSIVTALANVYTPHSKHWAVITLEVVATALNMTTAAIVLYIAYAQSSEDWDGDYVSNKVHTA